MKRLLLVGGGHAYLHILKSMAARRWPGVETVLLLATGPKDAVMSWGALSASGHWAWRWKDWIDRRFMRQYDLDPETRRRIP